MKIGELIRKVVMEPRKGDFFDVDDLEPEVEPEPQTPANDLVNGPGKVCACSGSCTGGSIAATRLDGLGRE